MGIKTEDFVKNLPPKEITAGIDWLGILDSFNPTTLDEKYINECARRNPYVTCYKWEKDGLAAEPIEGRMNSSESYLKFARRDLEACAARIATEGLTPTIYNNARAALIKAIGEKGAAEYNRREYERLGEDGRRRQMEEYQQWAADREQQRKKEEKEFERALEAGVYWYGEYEPVSMHRKIVKIRKGVLASNGKPLTQRDFAKYIGYPINKYVEAEKTDRYGWNSETGESPVEFELLEKLVMICHANPYWLFDDEYEADDAAYGVEEDWCQACVFATPDVILKWIEAGKPQNTSWEDSRW